MRVEASFQRSGLDQNRRLQRGCGWVSCHSASPQRGLSNGQTGAVVFISQETQALYKTTGVLCGPGGWFAVGWTALKPMTMPWRFECGACEKGPRHEAHSVAQDLDIHKTDLFVYCSCPAALPSSHTHRIQPIHTHRIQQNTAV